MAFLAATRSGDDPGPVVELARLTCRFGSVTAVEEVSLTVEPRERLALLGPSGCGKTTTLRLIAGFERPSSGEVRIHGHLVAGDGVFVAPERRRVGFVFQDYALFPHLTVERNIGYGLGRGPDRSERVERMLELVGLVGKAHRRPHELSGGEQQRVAIARALAPDPELILLDEPFSNLDAALRIRVRAEVLDILERAGATAVFVTHDQEEALSLADRVAVMRDGTVLQIDQPAELYQRPADAFVATFVGDADLLPAEVHSDSARSAIGVHQLVESGVTGAADLVIRPETVRLRLDGAGPGVVSRFTYFGHDQLVEIRLASGARLRSRIPPGEHLVVGDRVAVQIVGPVVAFPAAARVALG